MLQVQIALDKKKAPHPFLSDIKNKHYGWINIRRAVRWKDVLYNAYVRLFQGERKGNASCRSSTGLLQSPNFLCYVLVSAESIGSFKRRLDECMDRDDRWDG